MGRLTSVIDKYYAFRSEVAKIKEKYATKANRTFRLTDKLADIISGEDRGKMRNPYAQVATLYACISNKARNISQIPIMITKEGSDKPIKDNDPLMILWNNPNPYATSRQLIEASVIFKQLDGEWFVYPDYAKTINGGWPVYLWHLSPKDVKTERNDGGVWTGWKVDRLKLVLERDELIHDKYFNPDDFIRGLAPMKSLEKTANIYYYAQRFTETFFENDAVPGLILETEKPLLNDQVTKLNDDLSKRKGVEKAHQFLLLHSGLTAKTITPSSKDIQLLEMLKLTTDDICAVLGVPKSELSLREGLNYATALSEDLGYWKKTLLPEHAAICETWNKQFFNIYGYEIKGDYKKLDVLNREILEKVTAVADLWSTKMFTMNELNERFELGFEERPERDEFPSEPEPEPPALVAEPPDNTTPPAPSDNKPTTSADEPGKKIVDLKSIRAKKWRDLVSKLSPVTHKAISDIRAYINGVKNKTRKSLKSFAETKMTPPDIDSIINNLSDAKLKKVMQKWLEQASAEGVESIGTQFALADDAAEAALLMRLGKIKRINDTLREELRTVLQDSMIAASEGRTLSEAETAKLLEESVEQVFASALHRAKTIARTEIHGAYSDARYTAMDMSHPYGKQWLSTKDDFTRDAHQEIDGEVRLWNDHFSNGLDRPYDPDGPAEEVINCRCVMVPIYDTDEFRELGG